CTSCSWRMKSGSWGVDGGCHPSHGTLLTALSEPPNTGGCPESGLGTLLEHRVTSLDCHVTCAPLVSPLGGQLPQCPCPPLCRAADILATWKDIPNENETQFQIKDCSLNADSVSSKLQGSNIFTIAKRNVEGQDMLYQSLKLTNGIWVLAELRIQPSNPSFTVHPIPWGLGCPQRSPGFAGGEDSCESSSLHEFFLLEEPILESFHI
uniref:Beta-adaptin appendage C-terminal subdomain domain-containing protein n=1 Tax=Malurus cyaneus samueli TaxID=2593467 RepID=A0A8C5X6E9_9PASS